MQALEHSGCALVGEAAVCCQKRSVHETCWCKRIGSVAGGQRYVHRDRVNQSMLRCGSAMILKPSKHESRVAVSTSRLSSVSIMMASFKRSVQGMMEVKDGENIVIGRQMWMPARSNAVRLRTGALGRGRSVAIEQTPHLCLEFSI